MRCATRGGVRGGPAAWALYAAVVKRFIATLLPAVVALTSIPNLIPTPTPTPTPNPNPTPTPTPNPYPYPNPSPKASDPNRASRSMADEHALERLVRAGERYRSGGWQPRVTEAAGVAVTAAAPPSVTEAATRASTPTMASPGSTPRWPTGDRLPLARLDPCR